MATHTLNAPSNFVANPTHSHVRQATRMASFLRCDQAHAASTSHSSVVKSSFLPSLYQQQSRHPGSRHHDPAPSPFPSPEQAFPAHVSPASTLFISHHSAAPPAFPFLVWQTSTSRILIITPADLENLAMKTWGK
ncbi:hypothetical protein K469DRAFT_706467 [Zopfia rhizophila CBS 207.26]|uniref:Uncharacterized protein n=1 Tax=Zopfia rhizophila CBS 207.26 TaxID=1314779 RepID=A0A6A6E655_9PEZI|nr:hypothetical protein K469DRAFT_706467 [Zopfia rhizophila CBS 207.26]